MHACHPTLPMQTLNCGPVYRIPLSMQVHICMCMLHVSQASIDRTRSDAKLRQVLQQQNVLNVQASNGSAAFGMLSLHHRQFASSG